MSDEMGQVEEEGIIGGVLIVEDNPAVIDELYLLGKGGESILFRMVLREGFGRMGMRGILVIN